MLKICICAHTRVYQHLHTSHKSEYKAVWLEELIDSMNSAMYFEFSHGKETNMPDCVEVLKTMKLKIE
jgi:hypothetical protein